MICKNCFQCRLWGELTALTVGMASILGIFLLFFT